MKRLLAAGATAIYQIARVVSRRRTRSVAQSGVHDGRVVSRGRRDAGGHPVARGLRRPVAGNGAAERLSYRQAFLSYAEVDPLTAAGDRLAERRSASRRGQSAGTRKWPTATRGWTLLLVECVQPHLGQSRPTIVYDYPASQAALARVRDEDPPVAERFELFVRGVELANGYHELLEPGRVANAERAGESAAGRRRQVHLAGGQPPAGRDASAACRRVPAWRWVSIDW